jgi:hypothetical protein
MRVSPFLLSARKRFLSAVIVSLAVALLGILTVSANGFWDPGILWHTASERNVTIHDRQVLLASLFLMEAMTALILGGSMSIGVASLPADTARVRFLLSRPRSRSTLFLAPLLLAVAGLLCIPALTALLLIGWLVLVHAPVLNHLAIIAQPMPSASLIGGHPRLFPFLGSLHIARQYVAGFSFGICLVSILHSHRWLILSQNPTIRRFAYSILLLGYFLPLMIVWANPVASSLLFFPGSFTLPSVLNIALHLGFAVALCVFTLRFIHKVEI